MSRIFVSYSLEERVVFTEKSRLSSCAATADDLDQFKGWIQFYNAALDAEQHQDQSFLKLGKEIFNWLDPDGHWLAAQLGNQAPPFIIEFQVKGRLKAVQQAFIEVPWELLADESGHLARDPEIKFCPVRRIGPVSEPRIASKFKLNTLFMAASPKQVEPILAFEQEESAILSLYADKSCQMDLFVEESGNLTQLTALATELEPVDVVHLSCHGDIAQNEATKNGPYLCLESPTGKLDQVTGDVFTDIYTQNRPVLIFLSACKTAQAHPIEFEQNSHGTFTQTLIKRGFPAVLGWSGSVSDFEATRFASAFYRNLAQYARIENALATARYALFTPLKPDEAAYPATDWHLARLYLGPEGGGVVTQGKNERFKRGKDAGVKEFLGKKQQGLEVANRKEFVGRRRPLQAILQELETPQYAGILIHGIGNQGKSSLAARVANRSHQRDTLVIYGSDDNKHLYSAYSVLLECKTQISDPETDQWLQQQLNALGQNPDCLKVTLKNLLEGAFSGDDNKHRAILMVIDDLEKILSPPKDKLNSHQVQAPYQATLIAIISAFKEAKTQSRLIITSRYHFALVDRQKTDIAALLMDQPLAGMNLSDANKQYLAKYGSAVSYKENINLEPERVMRACLGNPGLQELIFNLFSTAPQAYRTALTDMESYLQGKALPEQAQVQHFLQDLALEQILHLLSEGEKQLLSSATAFEIPVPAAVINALASQCFIEAKLDFKKRLLGFGLLEQVEDLVDAEQKALQLNKIARTRIAHLSNASLKEFSGIIAQTLMSSWNTQKATARPWICDYEIVKFALLAQHVEALFYSATNCIGNLHAQFSSKIAAKIAIETIEILEKQKGQVPTNLYQIATEVCHATGEVEKARKYIQCALEQTTEDDLSKASSYLKLGRILVQQSEITAALEVFEKAKDLLIAKDHEKDAAILTGEIARIKVSKGEVDEALRLHKEVIQVFEKLGDTRSKAVTLGDIARIKVDKGEVDEALRLHKEMIQVFEKLGDTREKAVTLGDIARIKVSKGEVDEALRLHKERIQVFEKLGDTRSKAVTLWDMSQIMLKTDQVKKAFEYMVEAYQTCIKLGDLNGISMVGSQLGKILCQSDQKKQGLEILKRSQKGFEKLGNTSEANEIRQFIQQYK